ncbi:hypothetical protein [Leptolyngbya sp. NIES-2104]|uniref:hypothetical protein n=1 Tax=Leptolyngbya sp. NIES-2104 TaxID=1552121 RepID=UPI0006EC5741|nr:hypothetical protein [Leptolyngbya sp. NIES-2104]GAP95804.1 hypothetical protein NIES2104_23290 [Leptolyngbya sp. NIES-2104]
MQNMSATRSNTRSTPRKPSAKLTAFHLLLHIAKRHPFFCLFAVWGSFLFFGWLAVSGLTYTNPAPLEVAQSPKPEAQAAPFQLSKPVNTFGLVMLVTASCAVTSVLLAKQLRPVKPASRRVVRRQAAPTRETVRSRQPVQSPRPPIAQQARSIANATPRPEVILPPALSRPVVTVLPAEDDTPIEIDDFTLADMLDIRQRVQR